MFSIGVHLLRASSRGRCVIARRSTFLVVIHIEGRMETFKYRGSELLCEASGPDFRTAMIHTTACGLALDEPIDHQDLAWQPGD